MAAAQPQGRQMPGEPLEHPVEQLAGPRRVAQPEVEVGGEHGPAPVRLAVLGAQPGQHLERLGRLARQPGLRQRDDVGHRRQRHPEVGGVGRPRLRIGVAVATDGGEEVPNRGGRAEMVGHLARADAGRSSALRACSVTAS
jgi:hypothetical protein